MPRNLFAQELQRIHDETLILASMVYQALEGAANALRNRNIDAAQAIIVGDAEINRKRFALEDQCLTVIATQQPMAGDMRFLAGALEIIGELERIGDYAKGIGRITVMLGQEPLLAMPPHLPLMFEHALGMLRRSIDAFVSRNIDAARAIPYEDDALDELYNQTNMDLFNAVVKAPTKYLHSNYYSWAAHNLERTGDRAVNICERTLYMITGKMEEMDYLEEGLSGVN
jgi:phosphate transport system protein